MLRLFLHPLNPSTHPTTCVGARPPVAVNVAPTIRLRKGRIPEIVIDIDSILVAVRFYSQ